MESGPLTPIMLVSLWTNGKYNAAVVFFIGICACTVISNHTHVVLCVGKDLTDNWSMKGGIKRWHQAY
jgi:hypothetical protein